MTGTLVPAPLNTLTSSDTYPTHDEALGLGGYQSVANATARDAITTARRKQGMLIYQQDTGHTYQLASDLTTWNDVTAALVAVLASTTAGQGASTVSFQGSTGTVQDLTGTGGAAIVGTDDGNDNVQASLDSKATSADITAAVAGLAPLDSPVLTGSPQSTTPVSTDNSNAIATTAFVQSLVNTGPNSDISQFINGYNVAFALDATTSQTQYAVSVQKPGDASPTQSSIESYFTGICGSPKLIVPSSGVGLQWSPHNLCAYSEVYATGWTLTGLTVTTNQPASDGTNTASLLTATATTATLGIATGTYTGRLTQQEWIVKAGTSTIAYIQFTNPTATAYFDLATGAVGTTSGTASAAIYTTDTNGNPLPSGYYRIAAAVVATGTVTAKVGLADADGSTAVTVGKTLQVEKAFGHYGVVGVPYLKNTTSGKLYAAPYDWSTGSRTILFEGYNTTYQSLYSEDLTQTAWTKTNTTAALSQTGPFGEACSLLTATADGGTCTQSITNASANEYFTAYIKRVTGTGSVSITTDGSTFTDVTSQINTSGYVRVGLAGTANPVIGFQLGTSGDAIAVSLAICCGSSSSISAYASPAPTYAGAVTRLADVFSFDTTQLGSPTAWTYYVDHVTGPITGAQTLAPIYLRDSAGTNAFYVINTGNGEYSLEVVSGTTVTIRLITPSVNQRVELTGRLLSGYNAASANGEPTSFVFTPGFPAITTAGILAYSQFYLRRMLLVPKDVGQDNIRTWRYSQGTLNSLLNAQLVAVNGQTPNTDLNREPELCVLNDDGRTADIAVFWGQRNSSGWGPEEPMRIMQRNYRYTKSNNTLSALTPISVCQQQSNWTSNLGHQQSPIAFVVPSGAYKGRVVLFFTQLDSASGTFTPTDDRNVYVTYNDQGGLPGGWTTPTLLETAASQGQTALLVSPGTPIVVLPANHPVAPNRVVVLLYDASGNAYPLYSDTFGGATATDWTIGAPFSEAGYLASEVAMSIWPDGTLITTGRIDSPSGNKNQRVLWQSTDAGVTWTYIGLLPGFTAANCDASMTQLDPTGTTGTYGKLVISAPAAVTARYGTAIQFATDSAVTFGSAIYPWSQVRYMGYSSIKSLFGGSVIAIAVEGGTIPFNYDDTVHLAMIQAP